MALPNDLTAVDALPNDLRPLEETPKDLQPVEAPGIPGDLVPADPSLMDRINKASDQFADKSLQIMRTPIIPPPDMEKAGNAVEDLEASGHPILAKAQIVSTLAKTVPHQILSDISSPEQLGIAAATGPMLKGLTETFPGLAEFLMAKRGAWFKKVPPPVEAPKLLPAPGSPVIPEANPTQDAATRSTLPQDAISRATPTPEPPPALPGDLAPMATPNIPAEPHPMADAVHKNILSRIKPLGEIEKPSKTIGESFDNAYQNIINRFHGIEKAADIAGPLPAGENPKFLARSYLGAGGKAEAFVTGKAFIMDKAGNIQFTGPGLSEIVKPMEGNLQDLNAYLVSRRTMDLAGRGIETGISPAQASIEVQALEAKHPQMRQISDQINKWNDNLLQYLKKSGRIGQDQYDAIKANNAFYVPMERVMGALDAPGFSSKASEIFNRVGNPIRKIEGSTREIIEPLDVMIKNSYAIISAADRNEVAKAVVELPKYNPEMKSLFNKVESPSGKTITVYIDGKAQHYEVPELLLKSMRGLGEESAGSLYKLFSYPARLLRAGATMTPEFGISNVIRDQFSAMVNAKYKYVPFYDFVRGVFNMAGDGDATYLKWKAAGGEQSFLVDMGKSFDLSDVRTPGQMPAVGKYVKDPLKMLELLSKLSEKPTRVGVFSRAAKAGASDIESAFESREATTDFARRGLNMKSVNGAYAFFGARTQGLDKTLRVFKERPVQASLQATPLVAASIWAYLANRKDPEYFQLPQEQRDKFWNYRLTPGGQWYRIPKGDIGGIYGTSTEKLLEYMDRGKDAGFMKFAGRLLNSVLPLDVTKGEFIPTGLRPAAESMSNHNFFRDRPIIPPSQENLLPEHQYSEFDSQTARAIGKAIGMAPAHVTNMIAGHTGGAGRMALDTIDYILKSTHVIPTMPGKPRELSDIPGVRAFAQRSPLGPGSQSVKDFYENADQTRKAAGSLGHVTGDARYLLSQLPENTEEIGRFAPAGTSAEVQAILKEHPEFAFAKVFKNYGEAINKLTRSRQIVIGAKMPEDQKRETLLKFNAAITNMAVSINAAFDTYMAKQKDNSKLKELLVR